MHKFRILYISCCLSSLINTSREGGRERGVFQMSRHMHVLYPITLSLINMCVRVYVYYLYKCGVGACYAYTHKLDCIFGVLLIDL